MNETNELLPCPFCGGPAEIVHIDDGENAGGSCVCCTSCLASGNVEFEFKENFVSNWNRRASPEPASIAGAGGVTVKPLEWTWRDDQSRRGFEAASLFGDYFVSVSKVAILGIGWRAPYGNHFASPSVESAKAAAQADYEQRIRSALLPAPSVSTDEHARVVALSETLVRKADYVSERLLTPGWRPSRNDIESLRNLARQAAAALQSGGA